MRVPIEEMTKLEVIEADFALLIASEHDRDKLVFLIRLRTLVRNELLHVSEAENEG